MKQPRTEEEIRDVMIESIRRIAPETDPKSIDPDLPLRDQVDLDSMDFFNLLVSLHQKFGIDIPETDYLQFTTLRKSVAYLGAKLGAQAG